MNVILKVIGALKPFKELITIVVFLIGSAYAAMTHFATAQQLSDARASLEALQKRQHSEALEALNELRCLTELNRSFSRAEADEFRLSTLLEKNLGKTRTLANLTTSFASEELASLEVSRDTIREKLNMVSLTKSQTLLSLTNGTCSTSG